MIDTLRQKAAVKAIDYYNDNQEPYVLEQIQSFYQESTPTPLFSNIVKKVTNLKSVTYAEAANRIVMDGAPNDSVIFKKIEAQMQLHQRMQQLNKYVCLLKTILIRPVYRKSKMELDIITPDICEVQTGDSPNDLISVTIEYQPENGHLEDIYYSEWTAETYTRLNHKGQTIHSEANPYGVLPLIAVHEFLPIHSFWSYSASQDLINAQNALNQLLTDLLQTIRFEGFSVGVLKGFTAGNLTSLGPNTLLELDADSSFSYENPKAPIKEILSTIEALINMTACNNGLSSEQLSMKANRQSGSSKVIGSRELQELRRSQILCYHQTERDLFQLVKVIWNYNHPENKLSESSFLSVDYPEVKNSTYETAEQQASAWKSEVELGISSPISIIQERNPDFSRDQAIEYYNRLKIENKGIEI